MRCRVSMGCHVIDAIPQQRLIPLGARKNDLRPKRQRRCDAKQYDQNCAPKLHQFQTRLFNTTAQCQTQNLTQKFHKHLVDAATPTGSFSQRTRCGEITAGFFYAENRPLNIHISRAVITDNPARHRVVLKVIKCSACCSAGIPRDTDNPTTGLLTRSSIKRNVP